MGFAHHLFVSISHGNILREQRGHPYNLCCEVEDDSRLLLRLRRRIQLRIGSLLSFVPYQVKEQQESRQGGLGILAPYGEDSSTSSSGIVVNVKDDLLLPVAKLDGLPYELALRDATPLLYPLD